MIYAGSESSPISPGNSRPGFTDPIDWKLDVLEVEGEATLAVQRGRSTLVYRRDGVERISVVQFGLAWVQVEGQWQISVDAYWK